MFIIAERNNYVCVEAHFIEPNPKALVEVSDNT